MTSRIEKLKKKKILVVEGKAPQPRRLPPIIERNHGIS